MVKAVGALGVNISVGESRELIFLIGECCTSSNFVAYIMVYYILIQPYFWSYSHIHSFHPSPSPAIPPPTSHPFPPSFPSLPPSLSHTYSLPPSIPSSLTHPYLLTYLSTWETRQNSERRFICFHITYVPFLRRTAHPFRKRSLERCYSSLPKAKVYNIFIHSFIMMMIIESLFHVTKNIWM